MRRAVLIDIVRSPFGKGKPGGILSGLHPVDLYAQILKGLVNRVGIDPSLIEDVITGCVLQVGEQAGNIGRQSVLAAGLPESVPAVTLDRKCGSAQQAIDFAAQGVIAGAYDVAVGGGVEMMSLIPMKSNRMGRDAEGKELKKRYPAGLVHQGISAELIAARWDISREAMDRFALQSHHRASAAQDSGVTASAIIPVSVPHEDGTIVVAADEGIRRDSSMEALSALKPAFFDETMEQRFPEITWSVTAGSSSQVTDGAAAALIMEQGLAHRFGLRPRMAFSHFATVGYDPILMLTGVIPATEKLLARSGLLIDEVDLFEVNEAFASIPLAWQKHFGVPSERLNIFGGAIAIGHPVGASGGRLLANLIAGLEADRGRYGVLTMCESGGMANATLIERL
jgi:acetyl-CoA acetyltransferase family protein